MTLIFLERWQTHLAAVGSPEMFASLRRRGPVGDGHQPLGRGLFAGESEKTGTVDRDARRDVAAAVVVGQRTSKGQVVIAGYGRRRKTIGATAGSSGTIRLSMSPSTVLMNCTVLFPGHAVGAATISKTSV